MIAPSLLDSWRNGLGQVFSRQLGRQFRTKNVKFAIALDRKSGV